MGVSFDELIACVERELRFRLRVYPRWVAQGRMTQEFADKQLEMMRGVLEQLQRDAVEVVAAHDVQFKFDLRERVDE